MVLVRVLTSPACKTSSPVRFLGSSIFNLSLCYLHFFSAFCFLLGTDFIVVKFSFMAIYEYASIAGWGLPECLSSSSSLRKNNEVTSYFGSLCQFCAFFGVAVSRPYLIAVRLVRAGTSKWGSPRSDLNYYEN